MSIFPAFNTSNDMLFLLNPKVWIAAALLAVLTFTHVTCYRKGQDNVQSDWNAAKAVAEAEARRIEQRRQSVVDSAARAGAEREKRLRDAAGAARGELGRLRNAVAARPAASQSCTAETQRAATAERLLVESGELLTELARAADAHASDVKTLLEAWPK